MAKKELSKKKAAELLKIQQEFFGKFSSNVKKSLKRGANSGIKFSSNVSNGNSWEKIEVAISKKGLEFSLKAKADYKKGVFSGMFQSSPSMSRLTEVTFGINFLSRSKKRLGTPGIIEGLPGTVGGIVRIVKDDY